MRIIKLSRIFYSLNSSVKYLRFRVIAWFLLPIFTICNQMIYAKEVKILESSSIASTKQEAKTNALEELAQSISVEIKSTLHSKQLQINNQLYEETLHDVSLNAHSRFINPKITYKQIAKDKVEARVIIDNPNDYKNAIKKIAKDIDALSIGLDSEITQRNIQERIFRLENILRLYKIYNGYDEVLFTMNISRDEIAKPKNNFEYFASKHSSIDPNMFEKKVTPKAVTTKKNYTYLSGYGTNNALLTAISYNNINGVFSALKDGVNPNIMDGFGNTPLILAIENPDILELLLIYGANPEEVNNEGNTPMSVALQRERLSKNTCKSIEVLLNNGADPNHVAQFDGDSIIPIMAFYERYNTPKSFQSEFWEKQGIYYCDKGEILELFLKKGADVNLRNYKNISILTLVAGDGDIALVKTLLNKGAKVMQNIDRGNLNTDAGKTIQVMLNDAPREESPTRK
ncbi:ankyrin repeat domain-containing protein [Helicobacter didelphidarum]|nr:ankyrin repeat domain-containing protein [Helicobacter didelphidarum]